MKRWMTILGCAAIALAASACFSITTSSSGSPGGGGQTTPTGGATTQARGLGANAPAKPWTDAGKSGGKPVVVDSRTYVEIAERVNPAIVSIFTTTDLRVGIGDPLGFFRVPVPDYDMQATSLGTGFFISEDGFLLTNAHVVAKADDVHVYLHENSEAHAARVIGVDPVADLALLKVDSDDKLPYLRLTDSDRVERGEIVVAIGNPFGLDYTITTGVISAKNRVLSAGSRRGLYEDYLQTSAQINPGNSGGPLMDLHGDVVGINTAIIAGAQGIGFAIPSNLVKDLLPTLAKNGRVTRGYPGLGLADLNPALAKKFGANSTTGAMVVSLDANGPAAQAGVQRGDVIVAVNGEAVQNAREASRRITAVEVGQWIDLDLTRRGASVGAKFRPITRGK